MTPMHNVAVDDVADVLADYQTFVDGLPITLGARRDRTYRARRFLATHPDLEVWMRRPTAARLRDLHRPKAWPLATWLFVTGRVRPDLELLLSKPPGCDLPSVWAGLHADDVARVEDTALQLGWSRNWTRQVVILAASMICVWTAKTIDQLVDDDFDATFAELDDRPAWSRSVRLSRTRCIEGWPCALRWPRASGWCRWCVRCVTCRGCSTHSR